MEVQGCCLEKGRPRLRGVGGNLAAETVGFWNSTRPASLSATGRCVGGREPQDSLQGCRIRSTQHGRTGEGDGDICKSNAWGKGVRGHQEEPQETALSSSTVGRLKRSTRGPGPRGLGDVWVAVGKPHLGDTLEGKHAFTRVQRELNEKREGARRESSPTTPTARRTGLDQAFPGGQGGL